MYPKGLALDQARLRRPDGPGGEPNIRALQRDPAEVRLRLESAVD
jgi:hypothetical protein